MISDDNQIAIGNHQISAQVVAGIALVLTLFGAIFIPVYQFQNIKSTIPACLENDPSCTESKTETRPISLAESEPKPETPEYCAQQKNDCRDYPIQTISNPEPSQSPILSTVKTSTQDFIKKESVWGKKYSDKPKNAKPNEFTAIYLDLSKSENEQFVAQENLAKPAIKYSWSDFKNIKSENFGVYYYGVLEFDKPTTKEITVSESRAKSRIYIDGYLVYDSQDNAENGSLTYNFSPGKHIVEIEHKANWHAVSFAADFIDPQLKYSLDQAGKIVSKDLKDYDLFYVGAYQSGDKSLTTDLNILKNDKPIVLILNSYDSLEWRLLGAAEDRIKYILLSSDSPGGTVSGQISGVKIFRIDDLDNAYSLAPKCFQKQASEYDSDYVNCENNSAIDLHQKIKLAFNREINGFSGDYSPKSLSVPDKRLTSNDWKILLKETQDLKTKILLEHRKSLSNW